MMEHKKIIDISMDLNERTVVWRDDSPPKLTPVLRQPKDPVNFTWLDFGCHAGTHIDAPFFLYSDKWTADQVPFDRLMGPCQVIDLSSVTGTISLEHVKDLRLTRDLVLLKTKNSFDPMERYNPFLTDMTVEAAEYFVEQGIRTLGYDYQSFERDGKNEVHDVFLSRNVIVIDNLRLRDVAPGEYYLVCLPIKLTGTDGAPARAILIREEI